MRFLREIKIHGLYVLMYSNGMNKIPLQIFGIKMDVVFCNDPSTSLRKEAF